MAVKSAHAAGQRTAGVVHESVRGQRSGQGGWSRSTAELSELCPDTGGVPLKPEPGFDGAPGRWSLEIGRSGYVRFALGCRFKASYCFVEPVDHSRDLPISLERVEVRLRPSPKGIQYRCRMSR